MFSYHMLLRRSKGLATPESHTEYRLPISMDFKNATVCTKALISTTQRECSWAPRRDASPFSSAYLPYSNGLACLRVQGRLQMCLLQWRWIHLKGCAEGRGTKKAAVGGGGREQSFLMHPW